MSKSKLRMPQQELNTLDELEEGFTENEKTSGIDVLPQTNFDESSSRINPVLANTVVIGKIPSRSSSSMSTR